MLANHDSANVLKTELVTKLVERPDMIQPVQLLGSTGFPIFKINKFSKNKKNLKKLENNNKKGEKNTGIE